MNITKEERDLILSALRNDRVGNWGDGRGERIAKLIGRLEREERE